MCVSTSRQFTAIERLWRRNSSYLESRLDTRYHLLALLKMWIEEINSAMTYGKSDAWCAEHPAKTRLTALREADMKKALGRPQGLVVVSSSEPPSFSVIHAAHAASRHGRRFLLRMFGDRRLGGDNQTRDRRGVLKGRTDHLGRIDNAELDQVAILSGLCIIAEVIFLRFEQLADHHGAVGAGVVDDLACRALGAANSWQ
jgi:hypothetical protein